MRLCRRCWSWFLYRLAHRDRDNPRARICATEGDRSRVGARRLDARSDNAATVWQRVALHAHRHGRIPGSLNRGVAFAVGVSNWNRARSWATGDNRRAGVCAMDAIATSRTRTHRRKIRAVCLSHRPCLQRRVCNRSDDSQPAEFRLRQL